MALSGDSVVSSGLGECEAGRGCLSSSVLRAAAWGVSVRGLQPMPSKGGLWLWGPTVQAQPLGLLQCAGRQRPFPSQVLRRPQASRLVVLPSLLELPPAFTKAVELEAMAWKPVMVPTGPDRPYRRLGRATRELDVPFEDVEGAGRADSSGYIVCPGSSQSSLGALPRGMGRCKWGGGQALGGRALGLLAELQWRRQDPVPGRRGRWG